MNSADRKCIRVVISGRVQGVGYRYWMMQAAGRFGITGWVRNRYRGDVEAIVCGRTENINLLLQACRKGPTFANVTEVEVLEQVDGQYSSFEARPTA
ncbi:MAG TPA: acylphosphatase [Rhizobiales bacterium]|nr:acylphosphatase [Hyphomicrobiales bacterium]